MKRTLLDLTQEILASLNSDEVNSISDTPESDQVSRIIRSTYFDIVSRTDLPEHNQLIQLTASNQSTQPVLMYKPDNVSKIEWIKYFDADADIETYNYVTALPIQQFIDLANSLDLSEANVESFSFSANGTNFDFSYRTDKTPQYCTVLSNYYIIFDSFDEDIESTLQSSKTLCYGQIVPTFLMEDDFIPSLEDKQFPLLLGEAKSLAFLEIKQMAHPKAEQASKRGWSSVQRDKATVDKPSAFDQLPNFGRSGRNWWGQ